MTETENRGRKAALIAQTCVKAGYSATTMFALDDPDVRKLALSAQGRWTEASEETWALVKEIVRVFG